MKQNIFLLYCLLNSVCCFAQDVIYKADNTKVEGKVLEVNTFEIKYKLASDPEGPIRVISIPDLVFISYQSGSHQIFSPENRSSQPKFDSLPFNFCKNFIGLDIAEFIYPSFGMAYERIFGMKGFFGLRVPFSIGLANQYSAYDNYAKGKIFNTGVDFIYFPTGQGKLKYYVAPYFEWGVFRYRNYGYSNSSSYYQNYIDKSDGQHYVGGIKNGVLCQPTRHFCLSADFGIAIKKDETNRSGETIHSDFKVNILVGFRF